MNKILVITLLLLPSCVSIPANKPMFWAGMVASPVVHELGHAVALELTNTSYSFHPRDGRFSYPTPESKRAEANIDRAGYVAQLTVGALLSTSNKISEDFLTGYKVGSFLEISTYPMRSGWSNGDLSSISKAEYGIYLGASLISFKW